MSEYEKTNTPNMVIDKATGTVLNTDTGAYSAIKKAREEKRKATELTERVTRLEQEIVAMKEDLRKIEDNRD